MSGVSPSVASAVLYYFLSGPFTVLSRLSGSLSVPHIGGPAKAVPVVINSVPLFVVPIALSSLVVPNSVQTLLPWSL